MSAPSINRAEFFTVFGRAVLRSKLTWVLAAFGVVALAASLAAACWELRGVIGAFLGLALLYLGLHLAWELLPFSERTRARWAYQRDLADRYFSYRWRRAHWFGLPLMAYCIWGAYQQHQFDPWDFLMPTVFTVWGLLAHSYWNRVHADKAEDLPS